MGGLGRRRLLAALAALAAVLLAAPAADGHEYHCAHPPPRRLAAPGLRLTQVAFIGQMTGIVSVPGQPRRLYVAERGGRVDIVEGGRVRVFLDVAAQTEPTIDLAYNEHGMQSVAFAPDYARSRLLYVFYSNLDGDSVVDEFRATPDFESIEPGSERQVLFVPHSFASHHYGGQLAFGPRGRLFVSLGDADRPPWAQRRRLYGTIVSLDPARSWSTLKVIARGLRNPYHFTFDPRTGAIVVADVGETRREEIDVLPRRRWGRANLGWPYFEGNLREKRRRPRHYVRPRLTYDHRAGTAIMGGLVMRDPRLPALRGRYLYADFCDGWIASARLHRRHPSSAHTGLVVYAPTALGEDQAHAAYVASSSGQLYRLDPAAPSGEPGM